MKSGLALVCKMLENSKKYDVIWATFRENVSTSKADALFNLFIELDRSDSVDSIQAGFAAIDQLLESEQFGQAAFASRLLATNLTLLNRHEEAGQVMNQILNSLFWLGDFEVGMVHYVCGRNFAARDLLQEADTSFSHALSSLQGENEKFAAHAANELAEVQIRLGMRESALKMFIRAVSGFEASGESSSVANAKRRLGEELSNAGRNSMAKKQLKDAVAILDFLGWSDELKRSSLSLAKVMCQLEELDEAEQILTNISESEAQEEDNGIVAEASFHLLLLKSKKMGSSQKLAAFESMSAILRANGLSELASQADCLSD